MKKIRDHLNGLNLKQQLVGLVMLISLVLVIVSYFVTFSQVNRFVNQEMYNLVNRSQKAIIHRFLVTDTEATNAKEIIFDYNDPNITHLIYDKDLDLIMTNSNVILGENVLNEIESRIPTQEEESKAYRLITRQSQDLYVVTRVNDDVTVATILSHQYQNDFRQIVIQLIFFVVFLTIGVILIFFLWWATSIINPLKNISNYMRDIHKKDKSKLDTTRQDEIGDVARSIITMENELKRQENVKMEMIHNISHDLKTPITTIKTYSESIKDGIYPYDTLEKSVDVILENADRLERKAHSLLVLNQLDALEDESVELRPINMKEIVSKVILDLKVVRPEIDVLTHLEDVTYMGDDELWRICIENLLDNAFRYAVSVIEVALTPQHLTIYNDGEKMSEDRIEKLFKPYEKGTEGQFGLGLSIVDRMTKRMGYVTRGYNHKEGVEFEISDPRPKAEYTKRMRKQRKG
ncbi:MAG TPA: HAMP domain-containing histidine kinase [Erysipelothrix sp.]|jgi:two-component system sensor histidine kinase CssS|nr:HAMP domain-containing histidine kinase [Erysipelothrix sp.]